MRIPIKRLCVSALPLLVSLLCPDIVMGQLSSTEQNPFFAPKVTTQSPTAAAISKYGDYPVSEFSGVPDISIPLYEVQSGRLKLPVRLSYHASGFKVTDVSSWVGLGWTVTGPGTVSRRMMGFPDEWPNGYLSYQLRQREDVSTTTKDGMQFLIDVKTQQKDVQPDIFGYDFAGRSGHFFYNGLDSMKIAFIPYSPLRFNPYVKGQNFNFDVTDEEGNIYAFGKSKVDNVNATIATISRGVVNTWWQDYVISADRRDSIMFKYGPSNNYSIYDWNYMEIVDDMVTNYQPVEGPPPYSSSHSNIVASDATAYGSETVPSEIDFKNGKLVFETGTVAREDAYYTKSPNLKDIKVYSLDIASGQYQLLKTINFFQSYFIAGTDNLSKRMRLDSITICDNTGVAIQAYRFAYNNTVALPRTASNNRDLFGYYSSKSYGDRVPHMMVDYYSGSGLPPGQTHPDSIAVGGASDETTPDTIYMKAAILQRIYYPTGGYTDFNFETNQYLDANGQVKFAGGLRIRAIKSFDTASAKFHVKTYEYRAARPNFMLSNYFFSTEQTYKFMASVSNSFCEMLWAQKRVRTYSSAASVSVEPFDKIPVAYTDVVEYDGDATQNNGYTEYKFTDSQDGLNTMGNWGIPVVTTTFYQRGLLSNRTVYKNDGGAYKKVHETQYNYSAFPGTTYHGVGFTLGKTVVFENGTGERMYGYDSLTANQCTSASDVYSYIYSNYDIVSDDNYMTGETDLIYDQGDPTKFRSVSKSYARGNIKHQQVTGVYYTDSKGNVHQTHITYPEDYLTGANTQTGNTMLDNLITQKHFGAPIETFETINGPQGITGTPVVSGSVQTYKAGAGGFMVDDKHFKLDISAPIANYQVAGLSGGQLVTDSRYSQLVSIDAYDAHNNIKQYTTRNALPVSYVWDYQFAQPVAEVKGAIQTNIAYTSFEGDSKGNWSFTGTPSNNSAAPTGKRVYNLSAGAMSASGLDNSLQYIVTYWSASTNPALVTPNTGTPVALMTKNGWTLYQCVLSPVSGVISLSGSASIDEVRLYPKTAQMTTYTYFPNIGITSTCSPDNLITYYDYDGFGRLAAVRDADHNIVKVMEYRYKN